MQCTTQAWNIGKLWLQKNRINVSPPYQRESGIWSDDKKQLFIDSILNGYDVPKLYFHDITDRKEPFGYAVIDGKQRLDAIWEFMNGSFSLANDFQFSGDSSFFSGAPVPQGSQYYNEMSEIQKEYFKSQSIDVVEVVNAEEDDIEELFSRLNNGEPLNAAEKRNAVGGNMIKLIREIAKDESLVDILRFSDKRLSYHEVSAKIIRLEMSHKDGQGIFCDLKKKFLDSMVEKNKSISVSESIGIAERVRKNVKELRKVFGSKHPLMSKQSFPQLYYGWVKQIKADYSHPNLDLVLISFLESFHAQRLHNLELPEDQRDATLVEFGRLMQQGTNDLQSMHDRARTLTKYLLLSQSDLELKDKKRSFNEDERFVIWTRAGKQCQGPGCGRDLKDIEDMHADHEFAWSKGGPTKLANAQALCIDCNLKKSDK